MSEAAKRAILDASIADWKPSVMAGVVNEPAIAPIEQAREGGELDAVATLA